MARKHKAAAASAQSSLSKSKNITDAAQVNETASAIYEAKTFFTLPRELRDQIYEALCRQTAGDFLLYGDLSEDVVILENVPDLALTCVSRQTRAEFLQTMTGKVSYQLEHNSDYSRELPDVPELSRSILNCVGSLNVHDYGDTHEFFMVSEQLSKHTPASHLPNVATVHLFVDIDPWRNEPVTIIAPKFYVWKENIAALYGNLAPLGRHRAYPVRFYFGVMKYLDYPEGTSDGYHEISCASEAQFVAGILRITHNAFTVWNKEFEKFDLEKLLTE